MLRYLRGGMSVFRINHYRALEGRTEALRQALTGMQELLRTARGCRSYQISQDIQDPGNFVIFEEWDSLGEHREASGLVTADRINAMVPLLQARPIGRYLRDVEGEGG